MTTARVSLLGPDGGVARTVAKGGFESDADRSPFYRDGAAVGAGDGVGGQRLLQAQHLHHGRRALSKGDRRRRYRFHDLLHGDQSRLASSRSCSARGWPEAVGWWAGFGLAAVGMLLSGCLIQFDGGRLAGYGEPPEAQRRLTAAFGSIVGALCGPCRSSTCSIQQSHERRGGRRRGSGIVGYVAARCR